jgi:tetratricopeptide (TPR) repeat protein
MCDTSSIAAVAAHAENEYAQVLTEAGGIGLAMAIWFLMVIATCFGRAIKGRRSAGGAIAIGLSYGLLAILVHSISDFGQHIPANAILTAITCALMVSVARLRRRELGLERAPAEFRGSRMLRTIAAIVVAAIGGAMILGADRARAGEAAYRAARATEDDFRKHDWNRRADDYRELIAQARRAANAQPRNVEYRYWLCVYIRNYISGPLRAATDVRDISAETRARIAVFAQTLVKELNAARVLAPTFGPVYSELGYIERFILNLPDGAAHIRKGFELAPSDPGACFDAAQLAARDGDWTEAIRLFRKCMELAPGVDNEVIPLVAIELNRPGEALKIADGHAGALRRLQELLRDDPGDAAIASEARAREIVLVRAAAEQKDCDAQTLVLSARSYAIEGEDAKAIEQFRRAIAWDYRQPGLHFELAQVLVHAGRSDEAMRELRICLTQRPNFGEAQTLLKELSRSK